MRLGLVLGVALCGLSAPAFAAEPAPLPIENPFDVVREIFQRIGLPEGNRAIYDAGKTAGSAAELPDFEDADDFRCRFARIVGAQVLCLHP